MYILSKKYGRLCNRLFNAAHILALAIENKHTFINFAFYDYASYFNATQQDVFCRYPIQKSSFKNYKSIAVVMYYVSYLFSYVAYYVPGFVSGITSLRLSTIRSSEDEDRDLILDVNPSPLINGLSDAEQVIFFQGWNLRAYQCLIKHGDKVREYFTPIEVYQSNVKEFIQNNREGCDLLIGIVIRHGDYRTWLDGKYFYSIEMYTQLMKQVEALFSEIKIKFLICSEEEQDTDVFTSAMINFCFRSGHMIENLYSLAECDYIVSPPSTYGMWASFYGKKPLYIIEDPHLIISTTKSFKVCEG